MVRERGERREERREDGRERRKKRGGKREKSGRHYLTVILTLFNQFNSISYDISYFELQK